MKYIFLFFMSTTLLLGFTQNQYISMAEITSELVEIDNTKDSEENNKKLHATKPFFLLSWHVAHYYSHKNLNPLTYHTPLLRPPISLL